MARLYANENLLFPVVEELRRLGHDVLTTYESDQAGQATPDEDVLALAVAEGRILVTLNRKHFVRLHGERPEHAGIIVCTFDPDFAALAQRIHTALVAQPHMPTNGMNRRIFTLARAILNANIGCIPILLTSRKITRTTWSLPTAALSGKLSSSTMITL